MNLTRLMEDVYKRQCQMYVTLDVTPILEIKTPEYTIFINSREGGMAESWYQELKQ